MSYWLMKSEPTSFSIEMLQKIKNQITHWDGVRNFQARNMLRDQMKKGDLAFFYHSSCTPPGIAGIVEIVREGYPDPSAHDPENHHYDPTADPENPRWYMVDVKFKQKFDRLISIDELRNESALKTMQILKKGNRLSITPVTQQEWNKILKMRTVA